MNKLLLIILHTCLALSVTAQDTVTFEADAAIRENPVIEQQDGQPRAAAHYPAYINKAANVIDLNGDDWSELAGLIASARDSAVSIVHIGDSHLQTDFATAVVRGQLQRRYGSNGRGLIIPFKIAGTNEPRDYVFTSPDGMVASRLLKMPWPTDMPFTGIGISPVDHSSFRFRLKGGEAFDALTFHATAPGLRVNSVSTADGSQLQVSQSESGNTLSVKLPDEVDELSLTLSAPRNLTIGGVVLSRGTTGVAYHVIGNNGATYSTYSLIGGMGTDLAALSPSLIIISLGTNEAFGRVSSSDFRHEVDNLVTELRKHNPGAKLLLVTPAECHRRTSHRVRSGRGKRRRSRTVTSYSVNTNISRLRDVIVDYANANGIPVYDWYAVAGGNGSAAKWLADKNLGRDRIHLTAAGYHLQGSLMADALMTVFSSSLSK